ncbi:MAG: hypothetical protein ACOC4G_13260 [Bacillota bacterium]
MSKANIINAVEQLQMVLEKVDDFDNLDIELSDRVRENRVITLQGYFKFLEDVGIPEIKDVLNKLEDDEND